MPSSMNNFEKTRKTREDRGEDYAAKGRKLNKRDRKAARDEKRSWEADE